MSRKRRKKLPSASEFDGPLGNELAALLNETDDLGLPDAEQPPAARFVVNVEVRPDGTATYQRSETRFTPAAVELIHRATVDVVPYFSMVNGPDLQGTAIEFVERFIADMQPRNPAERLLAVQMLWQHARIGRLTSMAATENRCEHLKGLNEAIDNAMNVYRRQALAWQELRAPRPVQIIRGRQVNMAEKQVIAQAGDPPFSERVVSSNKQGCSDDRTDDVPDSRPRAGNDALRQPAAPALPAEPAWPGFAATSGKAPQAVAVEHRPADAGR